VQLGWRRVVGSCAVVAVVAGCGSDAEDAEPADQEVDVAQVWFVEYEDGVQAVGWPSGCPLAAVEVDQPEEGLLEVAFGGGVIWAASPDGMLTGIDPSSGKELFESVFEPDDDAAYPSLAGVPDGVVQAVAGGVRHVGPTGEASEAVELPGGGPAALRTIGDRAFATTETGVFELDASLAPARRFPTEAPPRPGFWEPIDEDTIVVLWEDKLQVIDGDGAVVTETRLVGPAYALAVLDNRVIVSSGAGLTSHDVTDVTEVVELTEAGGRRPKIPYTIGAGLWVLDEGGPGLFRVDPSIGEYDATVDLPLRSDDPQMNLTPVTSTLALLSDFETSDVYAVDTEHARADLLLSADLSLPLAIVPGPGNCS
jgi:hypothetical protein